MNWELAIPLDVDMRADKGGTFSCLRCGLNQGASAFQVMQHVRSVHAGLLQPATADNPGYVHVLTKSRASNKYNVHKAGNRYKVDVSGARVLGEGHLEQLQERGDVWRQTHEESANEETDATPEA